MALLFLHVEREARSKKIDQKAKKRERKEGYECMPQLASDQTKPTGPGTDEPTGSRTQRLTCLRRCSPSCSPKSGVSFRLLSTANSVYRSLQRSRCARFWAHWTLHWPCLALLQKRRSQRWDAERWISSARHHQEQEHEEEQEQENTTRDSGNQKAKKRKAPKSAVCSLQWFLCPRKGWPAYDPHSRLAKLHFLSAIFDLVVQTVCKHFRTFCAAQQPFGGPLG